LTLNTVKAFVERYGIRSAVCCFSGGRDSLVATHLFMRETEGMDLDRRAVIVDTTVMVPTAIEFAREVSARFGWPLEVLRPERDFWTLAREWGTPGRNRRWCCYALKLEPIFSYVEKLRRPRAMVTGLRRAESRRRARLEEVIYRRRVGAWGYAPIITWSDREVLDYMKRYGLPTPPHYAMGIPETCICGAFTSKKSLYAVRAHFPDLFQKFIELQEDYRPGHTVFWMNRKPLDPRDIEKQKLLHEVKDKIDPQHT
jgi:phosphoadenosine phosphosulfate reductase